ncbi:MAG: Ig-like domain-containing protein, partial [Gemmatimonadales bacterium]
MGHHANPLTDLTGDPAVLPSGHPRCRRAAEPPSRLPTGLALVTALLLSACLDDTPFGATGPDDRGVGVIPATLFLEPGSRARLEPTAGLRSAGLVRWESSDPGVATVQDDGTVTARQTGTAEIRVWNNRGTAGSTVTVVTPVQRVRSWRIAQEGLTESSLLGYWSANPQTSFAVGTGSTILRTDDGGVTWSKMAVADSADLVSVWGTSASNVYAVGSEGTILHYDGTSWNRMPVLTDRAILEVWGLGPNEIYAVGFRTALRYDGTAWRPLGGAESAELWAVWGSDQAHIFAVGQDGVILRLVGGQFVPVASPTNLLLLGLWGTGPESLFAVGIQGLVLRWDGSAWTSMPSPTRENLFALWGKSGDDIVAVGDNGAIIHFNGSAWSLLPQSASGENLRAVYAAPGGAFGAAGWSGTILRRTVSGEWAVGTTSPLLFDAVRLSAQLYAVGGGGAVFREAGTGWNPLPIPAKRSLFAATEDRGTVLAIGDAGTIVRYDGTGWQDESYLARWLLRSIWIAPGTGDGFIVGERGLILRRAGLAGRWVEMV